MKAGLTLLVMLFLAGCNGMKVTDFQDATPALSLEGYFEGKTYAWGVFEDRFGTLRRQFQVTIDGRMDAGELVLDEHFVYADGERDRRIWRIRKTSENAYQGSAPDVIGVAQGTTAGNALNWRYQMALPVGGRSWRVTFDDWMWLQPGGVLINRAVVSKWGVRLGTVTLFFTKQRLHQGDEAA